MRINQFSKILFYFSLVAIVIFSSCDEQDSQVPYVYVRFTVDLNINNTLTTPGNSVLFSEAGFGGVIVYCEYYDYVTPENSIFHAFDAACTYELSDSCTVSSEDGNFYGTCSCCKSKYEFATGSPLEGSATRALKPYTVSLIGNKVYVRN